MGPWPPPYGGIASNLRELLPKLAEKGVAPICLHITDSYSEIKYIDNVTIIRFDLKKEVLLKPIDCLFVLLKNLGKANLKQLKVLIKRTLITKKICSTLVAYNCTSLFTYDNEILIYLDIPLQVLKKIKFYPTIYNGFFWSPKLYNPYKLHIANLIKTSQKVLSCSNYCASSFQKYLKIKHSYQRIFNNVDIKRFKPQKKSHIYMSQYNIQRQNIVLLMLARFESEMGYDFILQNLLDILAVSKNIIVIFAGASGKINYQIKEICMQQSQCRFVLNVKENEKYALFNICDIFTAPSVWNHPCLGISNIEAMMSGKPVLSSDTGGHRECIIDGETGYLVKFKNELLSKADYLQKLNKLVSNKDLRYKMGVKARQWAVSQFDNNKIVNAHFKLIQKSK